MEVTCNICKSSSKTSGCCFCHLGTFCASCSLCSNSLCNRERNDRIAKGHQCRCGAPRTPADPSNPRKKCSRCGSLLYCDRCATCANGECEEKWLKGFRSFLGAPKLREYELEEDKRLHRVAVRLTGDVPKIVKRRRESTPPESYKAPRNGYNTPEGGNSATFRPNPVDIAVISWNINHFNKAEAKKEVIRWLFDAHPWLDVVVLQEINESALDELHSVLKGMDGIGFSLGPKMKGCSPMEEGPQNPGTATESTIQIAGETFKIRTYSGAKSFQLQVKLKAVEEISPEKEEKEKEKKDPFVDKLTWVWMRPNQPEYYPILFREKTVKLVDCWATYDGAHKLKADLHYWAKKPYLGFMKELKWPKGSSAFTKNTIEKLIRSEFGSLNKVELGTKSTSVKKGYQKKPFTFDGYPYCISMVLESEKPEKLSLLGSAKVIPARCRPAIVYEVELKNVEKRPSEPLAVNIAVIHTTPAGSKFNRAGEMVQVDSLFKFMSKSPDYWIAAGDYYLDPESKAQESDDGTRTGELFRSIVESLGLQVVLSLSATNQSGLQKQHWQPGIFKDQVERRYINKQGEADVRRVVNKRADFLVVTPNFAYTFGGIVSPAGGLMMVDPNHEALNWWSCISDHCPVGGILSTKSRSLRFVLHEDIHRPAKEQEKLQQLYSTVREMHFGAMTQLSALQEKLVGILESLPQWQDTSIWFQSIDLTVLKLKSEGKIKEWGIGTPGFATVQKFPLLGLYCHLALVVDCILSGDYLKQLGAKRPYFDQRLAFDCASACPADLLSEWIWYWGGLPKEMLGVFGDSPEFFLTNLTREVMNCLRQLNVLDEDFSLVDEEPNYFEESEIDIREYQFVEPVEDTEISDEEKKEVGKDPF